MYLFKNVNISWSVGLTLKPKHQSFERKIISTFNIGNTVVTLSVLLSSTPCRNYQNGFCLIVCVAKKQLPDVVINQRMFKRIKQIKYVNI